MASVEAETSETSTVAVFTETSVKIYKEQDTPVSPPVDNSVIESTEHEVEDAASLNIVETSLNHNDKMENQQSLDPEDSMNELDEVQAIQTPIDASENLSKTYDEADTPSSPLPENYENEPVEPEANEAATYIPVSMERLEEASDELISPTSPLPENLTIEAVEPEGEASETETVKVGVATLEAVEPEAIQSPIIRFTETRDNTFEEMETPTSPMPENSNDAIDPIFSAELSPESKTSTTDDSKNEPETVQPNSVTANLPDIEMEELEEPKSDTKAADFDGEECDEDLEEGEIEDDEEAPPPIAKEKEKASAFAEPKKSRDKEKSSSSSKHHRRTSSSKDKEKDSKKSKDKENKSERRRKHSSGSKIDAEKSPHREKERSSKKKIRRLEDVAGGDEDYLFVRGASVSPPPGSNSVTPASTRSGAERKIFETDPFGNPIYEDELSPGFAGSPEPKRRKKSRSPLSGPERRRRGEDRGSRRPSSARKETIKPLHKSDQICAYYMQGKCQKSHEECSFSHNAVPPRKMELCKFWMMDCCAKKEKCLYLHNDFPCKYYHTGLVCKQALKNQCKFSHKPMNEVTKAVLLKHIETAPKEILGDFPRLNRQGALNLMAKMENRINGELKRQEREREEDRRRTRWEQPTKDDEDKLHELMEEAGLGNYYQETVEGAASQSKQENHHSNRDRDRRHQQGSPSQQSVSSAGMTPLMGILPNQHPPILPNQPHIVHNPTLANVLASLHIPSTTIQRPSEEDEKEHRYKNGRPSRQDRSYDQSSSDPRSSPSSPPHRRVKDEPEDEQENDVTENLPPLQRGIYRRIQEQQLKNEKKIKEESADYEKTDDRGWYSSDEETDKPLTDVLKEIPRKTDLDQKPVVDFASVLSAIRKTAAATTSDSSELEPKQAKVSTASPPLSNFTDRGDVDFRLGALAMGQRGHDQPSTSRGPFRDTDFRVPPSLRQEFKDVDLRMTEPPPEQKPPPVFKSLPTGPATMIDAAINSHPPMTWKVSIVAGVKPPDYNYIRHTLTPAQLALDPRFGPRTAGGISILSDPSSPSQPSHSAGATLPTNIPGGDLMDPRVSRRMGQSQSPSGPGLITDPRLANDPRVNSGVPTQVPPNLLQGGWPSVDMTQAALTAQLIAAQQLGLLPFSNQGGLMPPNFAEMIPPSGRPPFPPGRGSGPPASSWERYSQQQSGGVTPPL